VPRDLFGLPWEDKEGKNRCDMHLKRKNRKNQKRLKRKNLKKKTNGDSPSSSKKRLEASGS
jgi:hypothetical protein